MTTKDTNSKAKLKLKELGEFKKVLEKASEQFCWAMDFTSFPQIQEWCSKALDTIEELQTEVEYEYSYIDSRLTDYEFDLLVFEKENEVLVD